MNPNDLFGQIYQFPNFAAAMNLQNEAITFQQQAQLAALQRQAPAEVPSPEERKQMEIKVKNSANYARWLARMKREPLVDVPFK